MKFGLFYELSVPRPWTRESERTPAKGSPLTAEPGPGRARCWTRRRAAATS
jgi:hypothetical protein